MFVIIICNKSSCGWSVTGGIPGGISSRRLLSHPTSRGGSNLMVADCRARKTLSAFWSSMVLLWISSGQWSETKYWMRRWRLEKGRPLWWTAYCLNFAEFNDKLIIFTCFSWSGWCEVLQSVSVYFCMFVRGHLSAAVARSYCAVTSVCLLPVWYMTSCFRIMKQMARRRALWLGLSRATSNKTPARGPVWARGRCRISPPRFLTEFCQRQLNQGSFVLLYFMLFTFSDLY